jgi:hypothetical protein
LFTLMSKFCIPDLMKKVWLLQNLFMENVNEFCESAERYVEEWSVTFCTV